MDELKNNAPTMYDLVKQIASLQPELNSEQIKNEIKHIINYIKKTGCKYFMLICKELNDFTLFAKPLSNTKEFEIDIFDCLVNRGNIVSIYYNKDDDVIEIWINTHKDKTVCYLFFSYDAAVLEYNEVKKE